MSVTRQISVSLFTSLGDLWGTRWVTREGPNRGTPCRVRVVLPGRLSFPPRHLPPRHVSSEDRWTSFQSDSTTHYVRCVCRTLRCSDLVRVAPRQSLVEVSSASWPLSVYGWSVSFTRTTRGSSRRSLESSQYRIIVSI